MSQESSPKTTLVTLWLDGFNIINEMRGWVVLLGRELLEHSAHSLVTQRGSQGSNKTRNSCGWFVSLVSFLTEIALNKLSLHCKKDGLRRRLNPFARADHRSALAGRRADKTFSLVVYHPSKLFIVWKKLRYIKWINSDSLGSKREQLILPGKHAKETNHLHEN